MRRLIVIIAVLAAVGAAPARAQAPPVEPPRIAEGVTVAGVQVGRLTIAEARAAVRAAFESPLLLAFRNRSWTVRPTRLGAVAYVRQAVERARLAPPGAVLRLYVRVSAERIGNYAASLDARFSRQPRNSQVLLRRLRPYLTKPRAGIQIRTFQTRIAITRALKGSMRAQIRVGFAVVPPTVTRANFGPIIVIRRGSRRLFLYRGVRFVRSFRIAVGMPAYPTPLGRYSVVMKERHPTWDPPNSPWAAGLGPVPPGPSNPLGTRWIGTSAPGIGIHGTPQPWTVGTTASHGCIRMYMREVEWLFKRVRIGTPIFIVRA